MKWENIQSLKTEVIAIPPASKHFKKDCISPWGILAEDVHIGDCRATVWLPGTEVYEEVIGKLLPRFAKA
jgi:hypothetical protein